MGENLQSAPSNSKTDVTLSILGKRFKCENRKRNLPLYPTWCRDLQCLWNWCWLWFRLWLYEFSSSQGTHTKVLSCQKMVKSDFQSQFSMSRTIWLFLDHLTIWNYFLLLVYFENFNFSNHLFSGMIPNFWRLGTIHKMKLFPLIAYYVFFGKKLI